MKLGGISMADFKKQIDEIVKKIDKDDDFKKKFMKDPVKAIESVTGLDLPDDKINPIIKAVKAKIIKDKAADILGTFGR